MLKLERAQFQVDDESDVQALFRQQFRRDIRDGRFTMDFAQSGDSALKLISDAAGASLILILSDIDIPGMTVLSFCRRPGRHDRTSQSL